MSLKLHVVLIIIVIEALHYACADTVHSLWSNINTPQSQMTTNDYKSLKCTTNPPPPFTEPLLVESKYDQADSNKDTVIQTSEASKAIIYHIRNYIKGLLTASRNYRHANNTLEADRALGCLSYWLSVWADPSHPALLNQTATKSGVALRKWALAAISAIILNTRGYSNGKFVLTQAQEAWLQKLADQVIKEYEPRRASNFTGYFNNHDYWAGWAVSATGMVLNKTYMLIWGHQSLKKALDQVVISSDKKYAWLPYEVARGKLAADYSNYAMIPLILLAATAKANSAFISLTRDEDIKLSLLGTFTAMTASDPNNVKELPKPQTKVKHNKMIWVIPFIKQYTNNNTLPKKLYSEDPKGIDNNSQISGSIGHFYPNEY